MNILFVPVIIFVSFRYAQGGAHPEAVFVWCMYVYMYICMYVHARY
jgi:hypothetical protein